jgi:hypothetical protein
MSDKTLSVKATQPGTYGGYRNAGEEFTIANIADFSHNWMAADGWEPPAKREKRAEDPLEAELKEAYAEIERLTAELDKRKK